MVKTVGEMLAEASTEEADAAAEMRALEDKVAGDPGAPPFEPKAPKAAKAPKTPKEPKAPKEPKEPKKPGRKAAAPDTALYERTAKTARAGSTAEAIVTNLTGEPQTIDNWVTQSGRSRNDVQAAVRAGYLKLVGGEQSESTSEAQEAAGDKDERRDQVFDAN